MHAPIIDWSSKEGKMLSSIVQGAVWSLVMLQQGSDSSVPMAALTAALDSSLDGVKPKAKGNRALHAEIQEAMKELRQQLLAA